MAQASQQHNQATSDGQEESFDAKYDPEVLSKKKIEFISSQTKPNQLII